jgi:hypothetical protein
VTAFDLFVGVDWSGQRGPRLEGLQVAACGVDAGAPRLVANPAGGAWTRPDFGDWLLRREGRVLCGLDFSFCFPWEDRQAYFPGAPADPPDYRAFWELVDVLGAADADLFGGGLCDAAPFAAYFRRGAVTGDRYERRLRVTEALTGARGLGAAESVFNLVGARQVGKGSLAGMRLLRWLKRHDGVAVWPFESGDEAALVVVETFPTAFIRMAGAGRGKVRDVERLDPVLHHFGSAPWPGRTFAASDHAADAVITAAALRRLAPQPLVWNPAGLSDRVRRTEGWTFGIG